MAVGHETVTAEGVASRTVTGAGFVGGWPSVHARVVIVAGTFEE